MSNLIDCACLYSVSTLLCLRPTVFLEGDSPLIIFLLITNIWRRGSGSITGKCVCCLSSLAEFEYYLLLRFVILFSLPTVISAFTTPLR